MTCRTRTVGFLVLLLAPASCSQPVADEVTSKAVIAVRTQAAAVGDIRGLVHATGTVTPSPGAELVVIAPDVTRIAAIPHAAGDRVHRGDVLVRFELPALIADVRRQQAEVTRAQAALENAHAAQTRASDLFERGIAARRDVEDGNRAVADAEAARTQARASLASSASIAARATVRATFDGVIARRLHNPGDLVEATAADPILRVIDPRRLEIVAAVPLTDASRIVIGAAAHVTGALLGEGGARARVVTGPTMVDAGAATVPVRLSLTGAPTVPVGAPVQVDIDAEHHTQVVLVPVAALIRDEAEATVFVVAGDRAQRRVVRVGLIDDEHAEIVAGVNLGELVIVDGHAGLPDGAAISVSGGAAQARPAAPDTGPRGRTE